MSKTKKMAQVGLVSAVLCILGPMSIPIGEVPISFTNFVIFMALYLLDYKTAITSIVIYILLGAMGMPVFSGFSGGLAKLFGPTGGYIIGFIPMALIIGFVINKWDNKLVHFVGMIAGTVVLYALGTWWFCYVMNCPVTYALKICVIVFIPGDIAKMIGVVVVGPRLKERVCGR